MMFVGTATAMIATRRPERVGEQAAEHRAAEPADAEDHGHADRGALAPVR